MVREIVTIAVGGAGIQIGLDFVKTLYLEHSINEHGHYLGHYNEKINKENVFFTEVNKGNDNKIKFVPRICLTDLDGGPIDSIKASRFQLNPDYMCYGSGSTGNNFAKGIYTDGDDLVDELLDIIRLMVESCDCVQGFQMIHSIGGGTGSGFGALIQTRLIYQYEGKILSNFTIFPSPKVSDIVVEPYNATLAIHYLLECSDETFIMDNESLFNITCNTLKQKNPKYADLNWLISMVMSGCTASLRFSGLLNGDLRKLGVNLVPFPRLHFFLCSQAPLFKYGQEKYVNFTVQELTEQMFSSKNYYANIGDTEGKYMASACIYRGNTIDYNLMFDGYKRQIGSTDKSIPMDVMDLCLKYYSFNCNDYKHVMETQQVDDETLKLKQRLSKQFVEWIPNNIFTSIIGKGPYYTKMSATLIGNTTSIKPIFQRINAQFAKLYDANAFLHWYAGEGMRARSEFDEADKNVRDLVTEYQDKQDAIYEPVDDEDEVYEDEEEDEDEDEDEE